MILSADIREVKETGIRDIVDIYRKQDKYTDLGLEINMIVATSNQELRNYSSSLKFIDIEDFLMKKF